MTLHEWLEQNEFSLALSSGFFGFFAHLGFVKALFEKDLKPRTYSGTSAGAIVAAALASGWTIPELEEFMLKVTFKDIFDPTPGFGLVRGKRIEKLLEQVVKPEFDQLEKPLKVSVFHIQKGKTATLQEGSVARAVRASCAIPFVFHPVRMGLNLFWDGGILDKSAVAGVEPEETLLNHYLNSPDIYERARGLPELGPNQKRILLNGIPRCGPHRLHLGQEIIDITYAKTRAALETAV